jgi:hypothetical protein
MRLNNKISIKGDTLTIFKEGMFNPMKGGANLNAIAKKIYDELQLMGSYDSSDRQSLIKQAGLSGNDAKTVSDMLFVMDADERYDDMSRYDEAINQYLEEGEDEIDFDDMDRSNDDAYEKAFSSMNELSTFANNSPVTSEYNGKTITWDDYEVTERNVDGGGYTNAIMLMGSDEDGNEYTCEGSTTHGEVDEWDDSTIEMVNSINEAKKAKTDPKDKKKADKTNYGQKDIADIDMVNPYELKKGIRIEMVDTEDYVKAMDKAVKKLKKDPMFYTNLIANSKQVKANKRSDLPKEVKDKKLNKTSDKMKDKANEMEVSKKDATKKNAKDTLNKKEMAKGKPKGVKEMTMKPKSSKGMKAMDTPGKETKAKLKESISIFNSLKKLLLS